MIQQNCYSNISATNQKRQNKVTSLHKAEFYICHQTLKVDRLRFISEKKF